MSKHTKTPPSFATLVQAYFAEYLTQQRALSPQTIAAYRDAFVLFLAFAQSRLGKSPTAITLADMTPELITAFLNHLEQQRHNCVRSRNARWLRCAHSSSSLATGMCRRCKWSSARSAYP